MPEQQYSVEKEYFLPAYCNSDFKLSNCFHSQIFAFTSIGTSVDKMSTIKKCLALRLNVTLKKAVVAILDALNSGDIASKRKELERVSIFIALPSSLMR